MWDNMIRTGPEFEFNGKMIVAHHEAAGGRSGQVKKGEKRYV